MVSEAQITKSEQFISLKQAIEIIENEPPMEFLWWGIVNGPSINLIAARAKAGKTICAENLILALTDENCGEFLGKPIGTVKRAVIISFEEHLKNRTQRQRLQVLGYLGRTNTSSNITDKIFVLNQDSNQFLANKQQRNELVESLQKLEPEVVVIDSLGRLGFGQIEASEFAQDIMLYIRNIAYTLNVPVIVLHHTVKTRKSDSIELSDMAGSRLLAQESDAIFTIEDGSSAGEKKIKPLAFRYSGDCDSELYFTIDNYCLLEYKSISTLNPVATNNVNKEQELVKYFIKNCTATSKELEDYIRTNKLMARSTLYELLNKIQSIEKTDTGSYRYKHCHSPDDDDGSQDVENSDDEW